MFGVPYVYTQSRILKVWNVCVCVLTIMILWPVLIHQFFTEHLELSFPDNAGASGVRPGSLSDQRERLSHLRRHATRCPVRGSSHQGQDGLRTHDLRRQGERDQNSPHKPPRYEPAVNGCVLRSAAVRSRGQTRETSALDSGAHRRWQPEPHPGRGRAALQALPAADGSAFQTGRKIIPFCSERWLAKKKKRPKRTARCKWAPAVLPLLQEDQLGLSLLTLEQLESDEMLQKISRIAQQTWRW